MDQTITEIELQYLRHLVGESQLAEKKMTTYADQCQNSQLKQMLQTEASKCRQKTDKLMAFLQ